MFIDIHVHCMSECPLNYMGGDEPFISPRQLVALYDQVGITAGVVLPCAIPDGMHWVQSNEEVLQFAAAFPGRLIPFCNLDPRLMLNTPKADFTFLLDYYRQRGCKGVGEMTANLHFDDPRVRNLFAHTERSGLPLTFHIATHEGGTYGLIDQFGLPKLEKTLQDFPGLRLLGHSQAFWAHISADITPDKWGGYPHGKVTPGRVVELMRRYPNLLGDLSAGSGCNALSRDPEFACQFLEEFQDRLFFGTDVCRPCNGRDVLINLKHFLEELLRNKGLSRQVFDKITAHNARRLLGLD